MIIVVYYNDKNFVLECGKTKELIVIPFTQTNKIQEKTIKELCDNR